MLADDIQKLETLINHKLPDQYVHFLLSKPVDNYLRNKWFFVSKPVNGERKLGIDTIYRMTPFEGSGGVPYLLHVNTLHMARSKGDGCYPKNSIAIGTCWTHEDIILYYNGIMEGSVAVKSFETLYATGEDNGDDNVYVVATSFREFLNMLFEPTPEDARCFPSK